MKLTFYLNEKLHGKLYEKLQKYLHHKYFLKKEFIQIILIIEIFKKFVI